MADKDSTDPSPSDAETPDTAAKGLEIKGASVKKVEEAADDLKDDVSDAVEDATLKAAEAGDEIDADVSDTAEEAIEDAQDAIGEVSEDIVEDAEEVVDEAIEDAEDVAEDAAGEASEEAETADEPVEAASAEKDVLDDDVIDLPTSETPEPEPVRETVAPAPTPAPAPVAEAKKGGMGGTLIGGAIAAALGAAAVYFTIGQGGGDTSALEQQITDQSTEISELRTALESALAEGAQTDAAQDGAIAELAGAELDVSPIEAAIEALGAADAETSASVEDVASALAETRERLETLEVQPIPEAQLPQEVTEAFERQLQDILATIEGRFEEMQSEQGAVIADLETGIRGQVAELETEIRSKLAELEALQATASATEEAALIAANQATARAAIARITVALDSGEGFADQLAMLSEKAGIEPPAALAAVAEGGAATLASLQDDFPVAARQVLSEVTREEASDGSISPLTSIILTQLGARSLEPREGDDPDAVMSRAEAAVNSGDLEGALMEIGNLPEAGQAIFADWIGQATTLRDAKAAAEGISAELNN